jgi:hypothetical protein
MTTASKSAAFLEALSDPPPAPTRTRPTPVANPEPVEPDKPAKAVTSRTGLKHIGGYFDREDVEKIAVLRARLALDNSQLIRLAVDELYKRHNAQRAFGDAK